jgi:8-oxo-dGTP pyrophosphatase MutT (NUDIX family)
MSKKAAGVLVKSRSGSVMGFVRADGKGTGIPCGKVDEGEQVEHAAIREMFEETGFKVSLYDEQPFVQAIGETVVFTFLGTIVSVHEPTCKHEGRAMWVKPDQLLDCDFADYNRNMLKHFGITLS